MPRQTTKSQIHDAPPFAGQILQIFDTGCYRLVDHADGPVQLDTMQQLVRGHIERVCTPAFDCWVNEEGLLRDDFEPNVGASWLLAKHGAPGYTIVGPAFLLRSDAEGECWPVAPAVTAAAIALLESIGYEREEEPDPRPPIAGGSGEVEPPPRWRTADQAQRREALHCKHCDQCEEHTTTRCAVGIQLATVTDAALIAAMGDRPAAVGGGSGEEEPAQPRVSATLRKMRTLIAKPAAWCQASEHLDAHCGRVPVHDPRAVAHCLLGARCEVSTKPQATSAAVYDNRDPVIAQIAESARALYPTDAFDRTKNTCNVVVLFNDGAATTHAQVLEVLDDAIARAEAKEKPIGGGSGEDPVGDALRAIRELLADPEHWTQSSPARTKDRIPCKVTNPKAHSRCLTGAVRVVAPDFPLRGWVNERLGRALRTRSKGHWWTLMGYNDHRGTTHADILALIDEAKGLPPIGGGSIAAGCIGRTRCTTASHGHCDAHEHRASGIDVGCSGAVCYCEATSEATEEAYEARLAHWYEERPLVPIAGGSTEADCIGRNNCHYTQHGYCRAHERTEGIHVFNCDTATCYCRPDDPQTDRVYAERLKCWYGGRIPIAIAGGSGEEAPVPFVAPTDSDDEAPVMHHFTVETIELVTAERRWFVTAPSADAIHNNGDGVEWEELMKEHGEDLVEKGIAEIEHDSMSCPACEDASPGMRFSGTRPPTIAGGSDDAPKLSWESKGRGGGREFHAGKYVIFHPYDEDHLKHGRGGILISKKWRVNYEDRHWTREHGWTGPCETIGTFPTVALAKLAARQHAEALAAKATQATFPPIAGGSGEEEPQFASCWPIAEYFAALPEEAWNQGIGSYFIQSDSFQACCVGAHVAYFLGTELLGRHPDTKHHDFMDGRDALAKKLDLDTYQLEHLLYAAGAAFRPFGSNDWPVPPAQVFANLLSIEAVPAFDRASEMHDAAVEAYFATLTPIAGGSGEEPPRRLTTRERRTNRMHRREEWADSRARKKAAAFSTFKQRMKELPPMGEPIKVGHHSEGRHRRAIDRVDKALEKVGEHDQMLGRHERAADAIAHELEVSIYDDDPDAIEQLQERFDVLEAKRTRMKAVNQWLTKHGGIPRRRVPRGSEPTLYERARDALQACREAMDLTDDECKRLADMVLYSETLGYPPYALSNLGGNIRRQVKRKERLEREAADA